MGGLRDGGGWECAEKKNMATAREETSFDMRRRLLGWVESGSLYAEICFGDIRK